MAEKTDHDMIIEMHSVLLGTNGYKGLCREFDEHKDADKNFRKDYYNFKRFAIGIFCFLAGAGVLTGGGIGIAKLIGG